jgi:YVTN family beta-propeller protein
MKNLSVVIFGVSLGAILLNSCTKSEGINTSDNKPVSYDALYVVNRAGNSLSVINLTTDKVQKTINLGSVSNMMGGGMMNGNTSNNNAWPFHISLSPDKSKLVVTEPDMDFNGGYEMMMNSTSSDSAGNIHYQHHNGNSTTVTTDIMKMQGKILILDATTGDLIKELTLEGMPYDAIFSPDGKEIWTTIMMPEGKVQVFSADSYNLLTTVSVGNMPAGVTFSDDGKKVFVANGMSGSVTVIDAVSKLILDTIITGQGVVGAFPGMHGMMYTDNEKYQTINIINMMSNIMSDSIRLGFTPGMVSKNSMMNQLWISDPNGGKIHVWTQNGNAYNYGGSVTVGRGAGVIIFSQDGITCYVANQDENSVSVVDVAGLKEVMKVSVGEKPNGLIIRYK